jgi:hypothetical protein
VTAVLAYGASVVAVALGVAFFVYAGADDSPGGQLLGLVVVIVAVASAVRRYRRSH